MHRNGDAVFMLITHLQDLLLYTLGSAGGYHICCRKWTSKDNKLFWTQIVFPYARILCLVVLGGSCGLELSLGEPTAKV